MPANAAALREVRVAVSLPFTAEQVAGYLFSPDVVPKWLGYGAKLVPQLGAPASLPQAPPHLGLGEYDTSFCDGQVVELDWPSVDESYCSRAPIRQIVVTLSVGGASTCEVAFRLAPLLTGGCRLRISQDGLSDALQRHAAARTWQAMLNAAARLIEKARQRQRRERQAIVIVHGVGEQRPGQMLREFVGNVFPDKELETRFVKPDRLSSLFEMRMVTVPRSDGARPTTDVYELYWAHLVRDTTTAQVYGWILRLLISKDARIPPSLRKAVWGLRLGTSLALLAIAGWAGFDYGAWLAGLGLGGAVLLAVSRFALPLLEKEFLVGYAGDAARYLEPSADNIARRQQIREAGANLLDALHDKQRYARIIVYGHSLGSVIAYDIISQAWIRRSRRRDAVRKTRDAALRRVEDLLNPRNGQSPITDVDAIQDLQHNAWREYQRNGFQWRISDLVTAGSPLAHATWLLNLDERTDFAELKRERSLPTCPPQIETANGPAGKYTRKAFTFTHAYSDPRRKKASCSVQVPHHAGLFAITRWSNLYFPVRGVRHGDVIAGALQPAFGEWIKDVRLRETNGFAHTRYTDRVTEPEAVAQLREALHLTVRKSLADYLEDDG